MIARNAAGECLLLLDGMVLDLTRWLPEHPGGSTIIPGQAWLISFQIMHVLLPLSRAKKARSDIAPPRPGTGAGFGRGDAV